MNKLFLIALLALPSFCFAQDCTSAEDCFNKGKASGFESESFKFYDKALKLAKKEGYNASQIYLNRGIKYYQLYTPNLKDAEKDFKASIKENEKNTYAYVWLANLYAYGEKDMKKANDFLADALTKFPGDPMILRERGNYNKSSGNNQMALADYEMAYNTLMDDPKTTDAWTAADIVRWYAELNMRTKGLRFADAQTLKILEDGLKIAPNSAEVMGDLALAYFDNNKEDKAYEYGAKAHAIDKKNVGSLFVAIKALETQDYWNASALMWEVDKLTMHEHPLVYYYFSSAQWAYCYNQAKNMWVNYKAAIKDRLQRAVQLGSGTQYDWYAKEANKMLASIDN
jgi:Tfp pilus assembly protein PilF